MLELGSSDRSIHQSWKGTSKPPGLCVLPRKSWTNTADRQTEAKPLLPSIEPLGWGWIHSSGRAPGHDRPDGPPVHGLSFILHSSHTFVPLFPSLCLSAAFVVPLICDSRCLFSCSRSISSALFLVERRRWFLSFFPRLTSTTIRLLHCTALSRGWLSAGGDRASRVRSALLRVSFLPIQQSRFSDRTGQDARPTCLNIE